MKIAPSILASNFKNLQEDIKKIEEVADIVHLDIMDGHFVPNISFGFPIIKAVRELTTLPLDAHLMIEKPENYIDRFIDYGVDMISVHIEGNYHIHRLIYSIKKRDKKAGVAINPGTNISLIYPIIKDVDFILIMSVNPGFSGQNFIDSSLEKIENVVKIKKEENLNFEIEVDGGLNFEIGKRLKEIGCNILVFGDFFFRNFNESKIFMRNLK
ncbi:MAG TPA: ribulose-phosphate 3-epimerase [Caldisericia bacterium]|nr:ribulose-phosphate 3-epimerase [Caldisericia bacterium]HPB33301.1 ribulose-phosphate 3-epimerase [Caldisericia bacterium]HQL67495.1 ribulose-phosphate 3-epimerase [Caldisericia bacterium]HQN48244.1 ribulose-phosphate 3-epimerase [Caldisericia bacterium]HQP00022.1 ribulose-phosphate 3-epimerase [Caldisericia bacterium]